MNQALQSHIEIGSLVRLNSGGPDMKVTATNADRTEVTVEWGNTSAAFPIACVYPV